MNSAASPAGNAGNDQSNPQWLKRVPMVTGVLAGLAGFLTVKSANMSNLVNYHSTMTVLHQARYSDAFAEYQADSLKRHMDENLLRTTLLDPAVKPVLEAEIKDFRERQTRKMAEADAEKNLREDEMNNGQQKLAQKDFLDYAGVAAQLGIVLASVAAMTRKQAAFHGSVVVGVVALLITGYALAKPFVEPYIHHRMHH